MKQIITFLLIVAFTSALHAGEVSIPHAFSAGSPAVADEVNNNFAAGAEQINDNHTRIAQLEQALASLQSLVTGYENRVTELEEVLYSEVRNAITDNAVRSLNNSGLIEELNTSNSTLQTSISNIESNSVLALDGMLSYEVDIHGYPTALFNDINIQVINGIDQGTPNGTGNVIIGYNTDSNRGYQHCSEGGQPNQTDCEGAGGIWDTTHKSGSHNLIVGSEHSYSKTGGVAMGFRSIINNDYATVTGGRENNAAGLYSNISGGMLNQVYDYNHIGGGYLNSAMQAGYSSILGGIRNQANGTYSTVTGGEWNTADGVRTSILGGLQNFASGPNSSISGGRENASSGAYSSISGGRSNRATGISSSISGGWGNFSTGEESHVGGGSSNAANGRNSTVSGGWSRRADYEHNWKAGTLFETR